MALLYTVGVEHVFPAQPYSKEKPNIIFILADNLGWTDLGVMGSDYHETPHIDRLASEGLLLDNASSAAANSAPEHRTPIFIPTACPIRVNVIWGWTKEYRSNTLQAV